LRPLLKGMQHHASPAAGREIDRPRNPPASRSRIFHTLSPSGRTCGIPTSCGPVLARQLADPRSSVLSCRVSGGRCPSRLLRPGRAAR
jgi:hypothetical protein